MLDRAEARTASARTNLEALSDQIGGSLPHGIRMVADNMWTDARVDDLLPDVDRIVATLPGRRRT